MSFLEPKDNVQRAGDLQTTAVPTGAGPIHVLPASPTPMYDGPTSEEMTLLKAS